MKKSKAKDKYRCPDGRWITNAKKMSKEWHDICDPICNYFGIKVIAFDPGIRFAHGYCTFDLPTDLAIKLRDLIVAMPKKMRVE